MSAYKRDRYRRYWITLEIHALNKKAARRAAAHGGKVIKLKRKKNL